jgi:tRNA pseudouridine38-40 synthase
MPRYALNLSYDGSNYNGYQIQPNGVTVQETIEKSLFTILREKISVVGCGRTDTGVHASEYFLHFDAPNSLNKDFLKKLNGILPSDIAVKEVVKVHKDWHARFDAVKRSYIYRTHIHKSPFLMGQSHRLFTKPDIESMNKACELLLGEKDFECFSKVKTEVNNFICTVYSAKWEKIGEEYVFEISANRFLRNMVRAIVGTLLDIGYQKTSVEAFQNILSSKDRSKAGYSVPANGLYLSKIEYDRFE